MPLQWTRGRNPYVQTFFGKLGLGANATPQQIVRKAEELRKKIANNRPIELGGIALDEHALSDAKSKLLDRETLAREVLLVHPHAPAESAELTERLNQLEQAMALVSERTALPLKHPLAILWFLPQAPPELVELPEWEDLELVEAGQKADLALDVVFDT